jgi:hypothetical protein
VWLHEVGQMGEPEVMKDKRRVVAEILAPHLEASKISCAHSRESGNPGLSVPT